MIGLRKRATTTPIPPTTPLSETSCRSSCRSSSRRRRRSDIAIARTDAEPTPDERASLQKRQSLHYRWQVSNIKLSQIEREYPQLYSAIKEIPWGLMHHWDDGFTLSDAAFKRVKRNGPDAILTWIDEHHTPLSETALMIIACAVFYHAHFTYDKLFEYLKDHNWAGLKVDRSASQSRGRLDSEAYEKTNENAIKTQEQQETLELSSTARKAILEMFAMSESDIVGNVQVKYRHKKKHQVIAFQTTKGYFAYCPDDKDVIALGRDDVLNT